MGDFTVTGCGNGRDYSHSGSVLTINTSTPLTIKNTDTGNSTSSCIYVASGVNANITLAGASKTIKAKLKKAAKRKKLVSSKVSWRSANSAVAMVSAKGKVTARKAGSCTVYAIAANGKRASVKVTVG